MSRTPARVHPALLWLVRASAIALVAGLAVPADAQPKPRPRPPASRPAPAPEATSCPPGSPAHREAAQAMATLTRQIETLAPAADHRPASAALAALLAHRCLRVADLDLEERPAFDSALSLQHFWRDGGREWLQAYLDHADPKADFGGRIVLPAAPRPTLSKETHPGHALAPLLCSLADADCGVRTRGFALRADRALERLAYVDEQENAACARAAMRQRPARRYTAWRACIERKAPLAMALPLGGLEAPANGWLVIHGRRGHYEFCDEIRAYDLASGAAYVAQRCDGLIRQWTGEADPDAGKIETRAGQVLRDNLREAAWTMLIMRFAGERAVRSTRYVVPPDGIAPRRAERVEGARRVVITSSDQTELAWSYVRQGEVLATGTLTWPTDHSNSARAHAAQSLEIAEAALVPGCPRALLPAGLISTARLGDRPEVSPIDAGAHALDRTALELGEALERLRSDPAARGCATAPRNRARRPAARP